MNIIEINKLSKYYHHSFGIGDITLNVPQGDNFGFIVPNGAGKMGNKKVSIVQAMIHRQDRRFPWSDADPDPGIRIYLPQKGYPYMKYPIIT
jgi:ABC-type uncharacterized transport system ATPase subunit